MSTDGNEKKDPHSVGLGIPNFFNPRAELVPSENSTPQEVEKYEKAVAKALRSGLRRKDRHKPID